MKSPQNYEEALEYLYHRVGEYLEDEGACGFAAGDEPFCGSWGSGCFYCTMADGHELVRTFEEDRNGS